MTRSALLLGALGGAFVLLYVVAVRTTTGQRLDAGSFAGVVVLHDAAWPFFAALRTELPLVLAGAALVLAVLAVLAGAWRRLAAAVIVPAVSAAGAQLLKQHLLARPGLGDHGYPENSYPSGHAAVVAALCIGIVLLWPGGAGRAMVAVGTGVALLGAAANVVTYAHRPSDVLGSLLLVAAVTVAVGWVLRPGASPGVITATPRRAPQDDAR